ncbi:MAG: pilus assembly protein CpaE [Rhodospirillales bacterium]|nr:pilus assembly protein CpaE [Rhodospirillales bacterium]
MALAKLIGKAPRPQPKPLVGFATDEASRDAIARAAEAHGIQKPEVVAGSIATAVQSLAGLPTPQRLLVDLTDCDDPMADLSALADVCDNGTRVITFGDINDVNLYRTLISAGIDDYLVKPLMVEAVLCALQHQDAATMDPAANAGIAHLVAVVGARGGVGATTIASSCAATIAHDFGARTALVDLDLYFGTCGLALDLETGRGLREALENPDRMDGLFVERAMVRDGENLFMLGAEDDLENAHDVDPVSMQRLIDQLRSEFKCIVLDLPRFAARSQLALLTPPMTVLLVTDPTLAGMRDTKRLHKAIMTAVPAADISVVLNRVGALKGAELTQKDFENGAEVKVDVVIPFDAKAAAVSAGAGKPFGRGSSGCKSVKPLRRLAAQASRLDDGAARVPSLLRFLKGGR